MVLIQTTIPSESFIPTLPPSLLAGPKYIFSFPRAKDQKEGGRDCLIEHSPYEHGWKCRSPLFSLSLPLLLLGAPKKKGEKEIVRIVWIEYSAGIGARRRTVLLLARVEFCCYLLHSKIQHKTRFILGPHSAAPYILLDNTEALPFFF